MTTSVSLIIPTRERAAYLEYAVRTCTDNPEPNLEILVLNNASTDHTDAVMQRIADPRVRYVRNDTRLSMRDNFEKGISLATGDILCFIGDDDGVFPNAIESALAIFAQHQVDAVSAARAHYFWPDLLAARRNTALLPRAKGVAIRQSRTELRRVLANHDYYRLPCLYHGFVKRSIVERVKRKQGRFFLSSQVDMYSAIALSMEGISYAYSQAPLVINGASSRSNGASHFGGGAQQEKTLWQQEDDMGFLPGFEHCLTARQRDRALGCVCYRTCLGLRADRTAIRPAHTEPPRI
jgi:glycosyltransferase involved in cell wall biosynthesis